MSFVNKVVLVTGASSGIGAATAVEFAKEGADVVILGRNETKMEKVAAECVSYGKTPLVIKADVSKPEEAKTALEDTIKKFGKLDVLVNNAGILRITNLFDTQVMDIYDELMATNLRAVVHLTSLAAPHLVKTKGNIVNISSVSASCVPYKLYGLYAVSKAGLDHFNRASALELAPHGVRVNAISPGPVETDIHENTPASNLKNDFKPETPLNRWSKPIEIADLVLFLASDKAKGITGSNYVSDNGYLIGN